MKILDTRAFPYRFDDLARRFGIRPMRFRQAHRPEPAILANAYLIGRKEATIPAGLSALL